MTGSGPLKRVKRLTAPTCLDLSGEILTVRCSEALPQGSRVVLELGADDARRALQLGGKVVSVRAAGSGKKELGIRLHNLSREDREVLEKQL
jgi:hypothetical protein